MRTSSIAIATLLQLSVLCSAASNPSAGESATVSRKRSQLNHVSASNQFVQKGQTKNESPLRRKLKSDDEEEVVEEASSLSSSMSMSLSLSTSMSMSLSMSMSHSMSMSKVEALATIYDLGAANPDFSTLVSLVDAAGLSDALKGEGPFTLFAPNDDAFLVALSNLPGGYELADILKYHALGALVPSEALVSGDYTTLNGDSVTITVSDDGSVMVNDANVIVADVVASNGIIHVIDKVLLPPLDATGTTSTPCPMCTFCPDGLADPDLVLPDDAGTTCLAAQLYASTLTENDESCPTVKLAEMLCCPPCPTDATTVTPNTDAPGTITTEAPAAATCSFCPSGLADPSYVLPDEAGTTCEQASLVALSVSEDDEMCALVLQAEVLCCPPEVEESMSMSASMSMEMSAPMSMEMSTPMSMSASVSMSASMSMSMSSGGDEGEGGGEGEETTTPPLGGGGGGKADKEAKAKKEDSKTSKESPFDGDAKAEKGSKSGKSSKSKGSKSSSGSSGSGGSEGEEASSMSMSMSHSMSVSTTSWLPSSRYLRN